MTGVRDDSQMRRPSHRLRSLWGRLRRLDRRKLRRRLGRLWREAIVEPKALRRDREHSTYLPFTAEDDAAWVPSAPMRIALPGAEESARLIAQQALQHHFDLLGSGWCSWDRGGHPLLPERRLEQLASLPEACRAESARIAELIDADYHPLDWQIDPVSGGRWSEATWYRRIPIGDRAGVDVKAPWELGRMQHLWALAHVDDALLDRAAREVRNQLLDFIAHNPPRWGVQWCCTMDVAIRTANWILAWGALNARGAALDAPFLRELRRSIRQHARHIAENLEWDPDERGNHYLSDLCGLVFAAAALPASVDADRWLALATQELETEIAQQFLADGVHIERSSSYHALCAQLIAETMLRLREVPAQRWVGLRAMTGATLPHPRARRVEPPSLDPSGRWCPRATTSSALVGMRRFLAAVATAGGRIAAIGDEDAGRFVKRSPRLQPAAEGPAREDPRSVADILATLDRALETETERGPAALPEWLHFPLGGYAIRRLGERIVIVRAGRWGEHGREGHMHNDQLSLVLFDADQEVIADPGSYRYTSHPAERDRFRATAAHAVLMPVGQEQAPLTGLFSLEDRSRCEVQAVDLSRFEAVHHAWGAPCHRAIRWADRRIEIADRCAVAQPGRLHLTLGPGIDVEQLAADQLLLSPPGRAPLRLRCSGGSATIDTAWYSPAYGRLVQVRRIVIDTDSGQLDWVIELA